MYWSEARPRIRLVLVVQDLGDEIYEVFCLYYQGGLTQAEIAEALDRDRKTVRKRLRQAHTHIDRLLGSGNDA